MLRNIRYAGCPNLAQTQLWPSAGNGTPKRFCYIQNIYPLPIGTGLETTIIIGDERLPVRGIVKTCHPAFGNGVAFLDMAPADRVKLESFLNGEAFFETE